LNNEDLLLVGQCIKPKVVIFIVSNREFNRKSERRNMGKSGVLTGVGTIDVYLTVRAKEDLAAEDFR
jgi:hypothetical protein